MPPVIHRFDPPERFVPGTVGEPGQRTFFLQARAGSRVTSVALEKQQVEILGERVGELLDELLASSEVETTIPAVTPVSMVDNDPLEQPITEEFLKEEDGKKVINIRGIFTNRCVDCHGPNGEQEAFPLNNFVAVKKYATVPTGTAMSLTKLAQTTHVHLLAFSMLYGLTGLIFTLTSYPGWVRWLVGPWPLVVQLVDVACWWLARLDPVYAQVIVVTGGLVAVGLALQIVLGLFNLFGKPGKLVILLLIAACGLATYQLKAKVIDPHLAREAGSAASAH